jgi:ABC-type glycerol-3-phosphate transport system permease component
MKKQIKSNRFTILIWAILAVLILYALSMCILYVWGAVTSLKSRADFSENKIWLPKGAIWDWSWGNYLTVWKNFRVYSINKAGQKIATNMVGQIYNTIMYAGVGAIILAIVPCVVAYVTQKFPFAFSKWIYTIVLVTMVIPIIGNTPSMLKFLKATNLYDTFLGTYIMKFSFMGMYYLVFYANFQSLSKEYYEAATIDGASDLTILLRIMLPLVKSTIYTVFLIQFIALWNDYNITLLYIPSKPTLAYGVYHLSVSNEEGLSSTPIRMACCMITATPILILFIAFRNVIMGNLTMGGVKE